MFTEQDYRVIAEIAEIIANSHDDRENCNDGGYGTAEDIASDLSEYFIEDNPKFDREKFMGACGF